MFYNIKKSKDSSIGVRCAILALSASVILLTGCTEKPKFVYSPNDFINPNHIVEKPVSLPVVTPKVDATFGVGNNPEVLRAYKIFAKKGITKNISAHGFKTFGYSEYSHPIVACAPLHLCIVQLEEGEKINNIDLGDSAHWLVATAMIGDSHDSNKSSYQIVLKPKLYDIATDMVITTNKRTYNIGLVSEKGVTTHVANFYYPEETLQKTLISTQHFYEGQEQHMVMNYQTGINLSQLHFNYKLSGDYPAWRPIRVFDDGNKTFIQMPPISERMNLPVLYLVKHSDMELVNYRYRRPYYVIDGLFNKAYLVSGKGSSQIRVVITNHNFS